LLLPVLRLAFHINLTTIKGCALLWVSEHIVRSIQFFEFVRSAFVIRV